MPQLFFAKKNSWGFSCFMSRSTGLFSGIKTGTMSLDFTISNLQSLFKYMSEFRSLLEIFFENTPLGIAVFDRSLALQRYNPACVGFVERYTSRTAADVAAGVHLFELLPGAKSALAPRMERVLAGERVHEEMLPLRNGAIDSYWDIILLPVVEETRVTTVMMVIKDVTERVQAYQRLERRIADRMRKLTALYDVMQVAAEPLDTQMMLARSLERVLAAVRATVGMIHLLDESGEKLQLATQQGLTGEMVAQMQAMPADRGLAGQVVQRKNAVVVADVKVDPSTQAVVRQTNLQVYAGVTIRAKGRLLGVLSVFRDSKRPFIEEDVSLLDSVADQIGVAVENNRLRQQAEQLAVVEERARLARDLHDSVTQALYSITLFAAAGRRLVQSGQREALDGMLAELSAAAQQALKEMRLLLYRLRPSALQQGSLAGALRQRLEAVEKRAGIDSRLIVEHFSEMPPAAEEAFYYIAQEALNNSLKHAAATTVTVRLYQSDEEWVILEVADNGRGFDLVTARSEGMGLLTMRERAEKLGGRLSVESAPGAGTTVKVRLEI